MWTGSWPRIVSTSLQAHHWTREQKWSSVNSLFWHVSEPTLRLGEQRAIPLRLQIDGIFRDST